MQFGIIGYVCMFIMLRESSSCTTEIILQLDAQRQEV